MSPNTIPTAMRSPIAESPFNEDEDVVWRLFAIFISIDVAILLLLCLILNNAEI